MPTIKSWEGRASRLDGAAPAGAIARKLRRLSGLSDHERKLLALWIAIFYCTVVGVLFGFLYVCYERYLLAGIYLCAVVAAVGAQALATRRSLRSALMFLTHAICAIVLTASMFDPQVSFGSQSVYMYLLPLAAFSLYAFHNDTVYLQIAFPACCFVLAIVISTVPQTITSASLLPPSELGHFVYVANHVLSISCLGIFLALLVASVNDNGWIESGLSAAIRRRSLDLVYQPQFNEAGRIVGMEALVRWTHDKLGPIVPSVFIDVAERTGLIIPLSALVMEKAASQLEEWQGRQGFDDLTLSINVSAHQISDAEFVQTVETNVLGRCSRADLVKLELTESAVSSDPADALRKMEALVDRGLKWSLDDYGTGYSNLDVLRRLPLSELKVDRSLIARIPDHEGDEKILNGLLAMADALGIDVVVEGCEHEAQVEALKRLGCRTFQGFYFAQPLTAPEMERLASKRNL